MNRSVRRCFLVPEVIQTSGMDCGPAALKSLLDGCGIPVSYGRLREACQTEVDGTSIDTLEDIALQLGLEVEQQILPPDHLLEPTADTLPAIVAVRLPSGFTHFVVVWRIHGPLVQLMNPITGRRWVSREQLRRELYPHAQPVAAEDWRAWAGSEEYLRILEKRMVRLGCRRARASVGAAQADPGWRSLAALDAATQMVGAMVRARGLTAGRPAARLLETLFERARGDVAGVGEVIPARYWSARPAPDAPDGTPQLILHGAVVLQARGRRAEAGAGATAGAPPLSPELAAALEEPPGRPGATLLEALRADGLLTPLALGGALLLAAVGAMLEAVLFRGFLDLSHMLTLVPQRLAAVAGLLCFLLLMLLLEVSGYAAMRRLGRHLEARLRVAFLDKLPRLSDRYFSSRAVSDMSERAHSIHTLQELPSVGGQFLRTCFELAATTVGLVWIDPSSAPLAVAAATLAVGVPLAFQPALLERELRLRSHSAALSRFYLDAMLGLMAVRTHRAERSMRREHESMLFEWATSGLALQRALVAGEAALLSSSLLLAGGLFLSYLARGGQPGGMLLYLYWALNLPMLGQELALQARQYPTRRNVTLRLLELLAARDEDQLRQPAADSGDAMASERVPAPRGQVAPARSRGVTVELEAVTVLASGHTILEDIDLRLEAGSHVAVVGPSGAGKSSLAGLLLGLQRPASGQVRVDARLLQGTWVEELRRETAWIDPAIQLWNTSLLGNLYRSAPGPDAPSLSHILSEADLHRVLEQLPEGLQTPLGEGGGLISGGEGQRVRLGRAMLRPDARLVILDEPFRGLDREQRRLLLERARWRWRDATLVCVTHDVSETRGFGRVLVIEGGRLIEDGAPQALAADGGSRYRALLDAETGVRERLWSSGTWRRLWLERSRLEERGAKDAQAPGDAAAPRGKAGVG